MTHPALAIASSAVRMVERTRPRDADLEYCDLKTPHAHQSQVIDSPAKRKIERAGRRGGKTTGAAILAVRRFLAGGRVLYATPTAEQIDRFWNEVKASTARLVDAGRIYKNETMHLLSRPGTDARIRAKTAWNADTLRGDYADQLILDEWQLMDEDAWGLVGAPMLLDNNGDALFIYTPPSLHSRSVSKARDPMHASKMYKAALADTSGRWEAFHFGSKENPYISSEALEEIAIDMTALSYRQEILAEDVEEAPGALWKLANIEARRVKSHPDMERIVVAIDPAATSGEDADETGIVVVGVARCPCGLPEDEEAKDQWSLPLHAFLLADVSGRYSPDGWARKAITAFHGWKADKIVAEVNNGGEMVRHTLRTIEPNIPFTAVTATRGKAVRAEPIAAMCEQGKVHHVGTFPELEEQLLTWIPGVSGKSPDRLDAYVWALAEAMPASGRPNLRVMQW